jgi:hypothetical protein
MYGLPSDVDLSFLVGAEVIQVCIGSQQAQIHFFPEGVSIFVETDMTFRSPAGRVSRYESVPESAPSLVTLLHDVVKQARAETPRILRLEFSSGAVLHIEDTSEHDESFQIKHGDLLIVV